MNIFAVILTKNEEKNIEECLKCLEFCSEQIVVDDNSTDKTVQLAKNMGAQVFVRDLDNNFSAQRNFGLIKTKSDWVLFIDSDEKVSSELREEIIKKVEQSSVNGFFIKREDFMWGKQLKFGETLNKKFLRLGRINSGKWVGKVHEKWEVKGKVSDLKNPLFHYPHPTVAEFLKEINFYTDIRSKELFEQGIKVNWWSIIFYPKAKFIYNYVFKLGFLDGIEGFIVALLMSFHSFLVRSKLWHLQSKKTV